MAETKAIKTALISVFHKDGLDEILRLLANDGVKFLSTGGTRSFIEEQGYSCEAVEDLTGYPSILGGRVKTLHPKVFGGILGRRSLQSDVDTMAQYEIPEIDLVIVDLYPFEQTVASGADHAAWLPPTPQYATPHRSRATAWGNFHYKFKLLQIFD